MQTLKPFNFNWKALNDALNSIVDAVNRNSPLEGQNVHIEEQGQQGILIHATGTGSSAAQQGGGGGGSGAGSGGQWVTLTVVDDQCNQSQIQVWAQVS